MVGIYAPQLTWTPLRQEQSILIIARMERIMEGWRGTPYQSGQRFRGRAADCIGSVFGVIDELDGRARAAYPGMPQDVALHNRETAIVAMRELLRRYTPCAKVEDGLVEPGDVVVTGEPGGGPGHIELVGPRRNQLWHSVKGSGFHQGGWSFLDAQILFAVYRPLDKHRWADEAAA